MGSPCRVSFKAVGNFASGYARQAQLPSFGPPYCALCLEPDTCERYPRVPLTIVPKCRMIIVCLHCQDLLPRSWGKGGSYSPGFCCASR